MFARTAALCLLLSVLAGCSWFRGGGDETPTQPTSEVDKAQVCDDAAWKAQHLGLWYNICTRGSVL
jgi:hypothetical protein